MVVVTIINIISHYPIPEDATGAVPRLPLPATAPIPQLWKLNANSSQLPPSPENCPPPFSVFTEQGCVHPGSYGPLLPRESSQPITNS